MNNGEFAIFAMALKTYYPRETLLPNKQAMELWFQELQDLPYDVASLALRKWVSTQKWSPSIADLRETAVEIVGGEAMTWGESWHKLQEAIRRFGIWNEREALESLDPLTRKCAEYIGYRQLCISENVMADRAHYQKIFETVSKREQIDRRLSAPLREAIGLLQLKDLDGHLLTDGADDQNAMYIKHGDPPTPLFRAAVKDLLGETEDTDEGT